MTYNLFISYASGSYNLLGVSEKHLLIVVSAWLKGDESFFLSGKKFYCKSFNTLQIFMNERDIPKVRLEEMQQAQGDGRGWGSFRYFEPEQLQVLGKNITYEYLGDAPYGSQRRMSRFPLSRYT
jgi:hypothetical protein